MKTRTGFAAFGFSMVLATSAVAGCSGPTTPAASAPNPIATNSFTAAKPSGASLAITAPKQGDALIAGALKVAVDYSGPALIPGAEAKKLDDYHLHYFLDEDATRYIGTQMPIPTGNPHIVHSAARELTFENIAAGNHTLTVVMTGNNHISVTSPLTDTVTFALQ